MANFIDYRISEDVSSEFRRSIVGNTRIVPLDNGMEMRNARWLHQKLKFSLTYALLAPELQMDIDAAFYAARAQLYLFRIRDYADFAAVNQPLEPRAGTAEPVQLTKTYTFGPASYARPIQAITECVVHDDSGQPVEGTLDAALGLFAPAAPWGAGAYTWTGEFDVWVRFASDELDTTFHGVGVTTADVELVEQVARR